MKKVLFVLITTISVCAIAGAHTIRWHVDDSVYETTSCEAGDSVTPPTAPTKNGYTFQGWRPSYTQVEYLESTGTQYIDTGYHTTDKTWVHIKFMGMKSGNKNWFGGHFDLNSSANFCFNQYDNRSPRSSFEYVYGGPFSAWDNYEIDNIIGSVFEIDFGRNKKIYINGVEKAVIDKNKTSDTIGTLWIFSRYYGSEYSRIHGRLYSFKIYEEDTLVRDFIPVLYNNVPCMYDRVTKQFFYNQGTGQFIAGPVLQ